MAGLRNTISLASLFLTLFGSFVVDRAVAHKPSDSYLRFDATGELLAIQWDISLRDLELLIGLDADQDGQITWGEVKHQRSAIEAHALSQLRIKADHRTCLVRPTSLMINRHSDGAYVVLALETDCPTESEAVAVEYSLLFDVDPTHRGLAMFDNGSFVSTHVLTPEEAVVRFNHQRPPLWGTLFTYVREGVWHIWIGLDHILFLICLLLPAVLVRRDDVWHPVDAFSRAGQSVLRVVTMFTVAHSITLWLAVMEYVQLPSKLVEASIALSIVVTAANNLYPILRLPNWLIAFVFGLVHGFGFANVLVDLGLSNVDLAVSLLGFNVGVELGQIAIVAAFMPAAFLIRGTQFYRWAVLRVGSVLVATIACVWIVERLFNAELIGI